jgi:hypothetical protein
MIILGSLNLFVALKKKALLIFLFEIAFIGLVVSQATWFALSAIDSEQDIYYLGYSYFNLQDATISIYLFLSFQLVLFAVTFCLPNKLPADKPKKNLVITLSSRSHYYLIDKVRETIIHFLVVCVVGPAMIVNAGGFENFIYSPGSMLPGQTFLLMALGVLKWNLLNRLIYKIPITLMSLLYFAFYLFMCIFTSRFMVVFALLQLIIFSHYYIRPVNLKQIFLLMVPVAAVILIFGIYRDIAHSGLAKDSDIFELIAKMISFLPIFLDWFFSNNTEVFSGVADSLRQLREGIEIDLLLPELKVVFLLLPNFIRTDDNLIFARLLDEIIYSGVQSNSVIASGFERFVLGLGVMGFAVYSMVLLLFLFAAEIALRRKRRSFISVASVQALNGLRGSLAGVLLFFGLADYVASKVFRLCLIRRFNYTPRKSAAHSQ